MNLLDVMYLSKQCHGYLFANVERSVDVCSKAFIRTSIELSRGPKVVVMTIMTSSYLWNQQIKLPKTQFSFVFHLYITFNIS